MNWILLALAPVLLGALAGALLAPKNRGKKKAQPQFIVAFPARTRACAALTVLAMLLALGATALWGGGALNRYAPFYLVYTVCIGLGLALFAHMSTAYIEVTGDRILVHRRSGKPQAYAAGQIAWLNARKYDVQACKADGSVLFTVGIQMENLDLFFTWTHAHPAIKVTVNGKGLPAPQKK